MKKIICIVLVGLFTYIQLLGQENFNWRIEILQNNNDIHIRQAIVDSIVNESFWKNNADYMKWYVNVFSKEDFTEYSKERLLSYFNRALNNLEKDKIRNSCQLRLGNDINRYKQEAEKEGLSFEDYFNKILNKEIEKDIYIMSKQAEKTISPLYARILGWLNYEKAVPILESVIKDSLSIDEYAKYNKKEFEMSCKLALARMGNKQYEIEILSSLKKEIPNCNDPEFLDFLLDLFYINTKKSINFVIQLTDDYKVYEKPYMYGLVNKCSLKDIILIYISKVITNYPIIFENENTKDVDKNFPQGSSLDDFYRKQYDGLLKWLKNNKNDCHINNDQFF